MTCRPLLRSLGALLCCAGLAGCLLTGGQAGTVDAAGSDDAGPKDAVADTESPDTESPDTESPDTESPDTESPDTTSEGDTGAEDTGAVEDTGDIERDTGGGMQEDTGDIERDTGGGMEEDTGRPYRTKEVCGDGRDNDADSLVDSCDPDCQMDCASRNGAACRRNSAGLKICRELNCVVGSGDEDLDGREDCQDPDCTMMRCGGESGDLESQRCCSGPAQNSCKRRYCPS